MNNEEIIVLSEDITTKIAAGEIIERPANVVKELVENALDADSDEIKIEIVRGGKGLIRVSDNGKGIYPNELEKTILRFATSKIKELEDLTKVQTYGFRGEALAAISSVSKFSIKSGKTGFDTYELSVNFGKVNSCNMTSPYIGTVVSVENIFMEIPARYKFLKSNASETREITKLIKKFIIINDNVTFAYYVDGKKIYHYIKGYNALKRANELLDENRLKPVEYRDNKYNIKGIISDPLVQKHKAEDIIIYVNGRIVKDNVILKAIKQGYSFVLPHNKCPVAIFDIKVSGNDIDVNIHPAKNMIKWLNPNEIFHIIYNIIKSNISKESLSLVGEYRWVENENPINKKYGYKEIYNDLLLFDEEVQNSTLVKNNELKVLGQLFNTVIVVEKKDKVYFIDQHIAHERVLFEKFLHNNILNDNISVNLSEPILYEFAIDKIEFLENSIEDFLSLGFGFERFGRNAIKLTKVPSYIIKKDIGDIFESMVNELDEITDDSLKSKIIASLSCKAAIKANEKLSYYEMETLVNDLFDSENPYTCPHGRKIIFELTMEDLYRKFNRL